MEQVDVQRKDFNRLGVHGRLGRIPYLTLAPRYEAEQLRAFAQIVRNGHLYKGYKPVHWCLDCRSALAEAEVEYEERTSPSIDVRFDVVDRADLARRTRRCATLPTGRASIVIWTTTPWTLPANQAVALHPEFDYVAARGRRRRAARNCCCSRRNSRRPCSRAPASTASRELGARRRARRSRACSCGIRSTIASCR